MNIQPLRCPRSPLKNVREYKIFVETPGSKGVSTRCPPVFQRAPRPHGVALILVLISMVIIAGATALFIGLTDAENQGTDALRRYTVADAMSEAATQYAIRTVENAVANYGTPPATIAVTIENTAITCNVFQIPNAKRTEVYNATTNTWVTYTAGAQGFQRVVYPYEVDAPVIYQESTGAPLATSRVVKIVEVHAEPLFQFLAFFGNSSPLEITTGPDSVFTGRIHANQDIYFGNSSYSAGNSQTFNTDYLHTAGRVHRSRLDNYQNQPAADLQATGGTVNIKIKGTAGTDSSGNIITGNYKQEASKISYDTASPVVKNTFDSTNNYMTTGFDSNFSGFDPNGKTDFSSSGAILPFNQVAPSLYGGTLQTAAQGVAPLSVPAVGSLNPYTPTTGGTGGNFIQPDPTKNVFTPVAAGTGNFQKSYYNANATLVIKYDKTAGKSKVFDSTGADITSTLPPGTITDVPAVAPATPTAAGNPNLYDARQSKWVGLTDINMRLLNTVTQFSGATVPDTNGGASSTAAGAVIYMYREDSSTTQPNGFRIVEGQTLANRVTFVSQDPVYVRGDFNTGQDHPFNDVNSSGNHTGNDIKTGLSIDNFAKAANQKGSAILADAVNVLSNAWAYAPTDGQASNPSATSTGSKTPSTSSAKATPTSVNFAMLSGVTASTAGGAYSGGLENFQRFHEDWSGVIENYRGSYVNLYASQIGTGPWGNATYSPPTRHWDFDTSYLDPTKLPPLTPLVVGTNQVVWYRGAVSVP